MFSLYEWYNLEGQLIRKKKVLCAKKKKNTSPRLRGIDRLILRITKTVRSDYSRGSFRKGRHAPRFWKVRKGEWRNPFSGAFNGKARVREIAGKIKNISEIANYINHETRVYLVNRKVSTSLFEILNVFLTFFYYFLKTLWKMMIWKMKKRNKVNIFMQFVCHSLATFLASYSHQNQKNEQI